MKIRPLHQFLLYLMILLSLCCTNPAASETVPNRISLAISGGASKGAYEAGLIWGLYQMIVLKRGFREVLAGCQIAKEKDWDKETKETVKKLYAPQTEALVADVKATLPKVPTAP